MTTINRYHLETPAGRASLVITQGKDGKFNAYANTLDKVLHPLVGNARTAEEAEDMARCGLGTVVAVLN